MKKQISFVGASICVCVSLLFLTASTPSPFSDAFTSLMKKAKEIWPEDRVYLHVDKVYYRPGETVWFSAYVRNGVDLTASRQSDIVRVQLIGPDNTIIRTHSLIAKKGLAEGDFDIPIASTGGKYTLRAYTQWQLNDPRPVIFEKEIQVRQATASSEKIQEISTPETTSPKALTLTFFPEGGDLVVGLPCRIAFQARDAAGNPVNINSPLKDSKGNEMANITTLHDGMGSFVLTPETGETYTANIEGQTFSIPEALPEGIAMSVKKTDSAFIYLDVMASHDQEIIVALALRGKSQFRTTLPLSKGKNEINLPIGNLPIGVAQVTCFGGEGIAMVERLVFVNPHKQMNIMVNVQEPFAGKSFSPGEKVTMTLRTTDTEFTTQPAQLSMAVVEEARLPLEYAGSNLLTHLLLEADVRGRILNPGFYLNPKEPLATQALDLVLMTHGWRRFTWEEVAQAGDLLPYQGERLAIAGTVVSGYMGGPIPHASVSIEELGQTQKTNVDGSFSFSLVEPLSSYTITVKATGYISVRQKVSGVTSDLRYQLNALPIILSDRQFFVNAPIAKPVSTRIEAPPVPDYREREPSLPAWQEAGKLPRTFQLAEAIPPQKIKKDEEDYHEAKTLKEQEIMPEFDIYRPSGISMGDGFIKKSTARGIGNLLAISSEVYQTDAGSSSFNVRGSRDYATKIIVDGQTLRGGLNSLPQAALKNMQLISGGVPAEYGDFTGGIVVIETEGPDYTKFYKDQILLQIEKRPEIQNLEALISQIEYPAEAKEKGLEGQATFKVWVDAHGQYLRHKTLSRTHPAFRNACIPYLKDLVCQPALTDSGETYPYWVEIPFDFVLEETNTVKSDSITVLPNLDMRRTYYRARKFSEEKSNSSTLLTQGAPTTIYWRGRIDTPEKGAIRLSFPAGILPGLYRVIIEGISEVGLPGRVASVIEVR